MNGILFDLVNEPFYLLLAGGPNVNSDSVGFHNSDRGVTGERFWLGDPPSDYDFIYNGCGSVKLCFGMPEGCVASRNCDLVSTVYDNNGDFEFELLGIGMKR